MTQIYEVTQSKYCFCLPPYLVKWTHPNIFWEILCWLPIALKQTTLTLSSLYNNHFLVILMALGSPQRFLLRSWQVIVRQRLGRNPWVPELWSLKHLRAGIAGAFCSISLSFFRLGLCTWSFCHHDSELQNCTTRRRDGQSEAALCVIT